MIIFLNLPRTNDLSNVNNAQKLKEMLKNAASRNIVLFSSRNPLHVLDTLNDTFMKDFNWILSRPDSTEEIGLATMDMGKK